MAASGAWRQGLKFTLVVPASRAGYLLLVLCLARVYGARGIADQVFLAEGMIALVSMGMAVVIDAVAIPALYRMQNFQDQELFIRDFTCKVMFWACLGAALALACFVMWMHTHQQKLSTSVIALALLPPISASAAIYSARWVVQGAIIRPQLGHVFASVVCIPGVFILPPSASAVVVIMLAYELLRWLLSRSLFYLSSPARAVSRISPAATSMSVDAGQKGALELQVMSYFIASLPFLLGLLSASRISPGSISMLSYLNRLWSACILMFSGFLLYVLTWFQREESRQLRSVDRLAGISWLVGLAVVPGLVFACWILSSFWFDRSVWSDSQRALWLQAVPIYFMAIPAYLSGMIYVRAANAQHRHWPIFWASCVNLGVYAGVLWWQARLSFNALAWAHLGGQFSQMMVLFAAARPCFENSLGSVNKRR